ncbi:MAG: hypothetical protein ROZ37_13710 [Aromatoleum sp.]|jgi:hypothetical protein|uniref:hypothetical protein n=1 Tax=Aromatoleum sp. TaxID=2307007 RepID=UPI0028947375|nr:hypothetical protein [Aromatoleum sp.]MDT3671371.1 hypothetical protein [Aromatoleum sp.]
MNSNVLALAVAAAVSIATTSATAAVRDAPPYEAAVQQQDTGEPWRVDATVRRGMGDLRSTVDAGVAGRAIGSISGERLGELGRVIEARVGEMIACCATRETSGRHLHMVLAEMADGATLMMQGGHADARRMGLLKVVQALNLYGDLFDHSGWQPLNESIAVSAR